MANEIILENFFSQLAEILEVDAINPQEVLADFSTWDSLSILTIAAMADTCFGVSLTTGDIKGAHTAGELADLIASRKSH